MQLKSKIDGSVGLMYSITTNSFTNDIYKVDRFSPSILREAKLLEVDMYQSGISLGFPIHSLKVFECNALVRW